MKHVDEYYIEKNDRDQLLDNLSTIRRLWRTLEDTLTRQNNFHPRLNIRKSDRPVTPLPFHLGASRISHRTAHGIAAIAAAVATQRKLTPPPYHNTVITIMWLENNIMQLAQCEDSEDYATQVNSMARSIIHVVDTPKPNTIFGACPHCLEPLLAPVEVCRNCGETITKDAAQDTLNTLKYQKTLTRHEAHDWLAARGIPQRTRNFWLNELTQYWDGHDWVWVWGDLDSRTRDWLKKRKTK
ncbi:MAG: hypothetical protein WAN89_02805 [Lawsonella sp.]